jgi:hypothetical protein
MYIVYSGFIYYFYNTNRKTSGLHSVYHLDQQYKQKNIRSPQCLPSGPIIQTEKHQVSTVFTIWTNNTNRKTSGLHSVYQLDKQYKQKNIRSPHSLPLWRPDVFLFVLLVQMVNTVET